MAGYFGKLPARADFVIGQCPKGFLKLWEPFLLKGLSQSRLDLSDSWKEAYMTMPIWRFDVTLQDRAGPDPETRMVAGAFMPSIDRVGREYPLTVASDMNADQGAPPAHWYAAAEAVLLSALQEDGRFEDFQRAVAELPIPTGEAGHVAGEWTELPAMAGTDTVTVSNFRSRGGDRDFVFACKGLPDAGAFRWLILPEQIPEGQETAGVNHGRYHPEDHRT
ncbi:type VI secretion system-associated protein TagF [Labrenzia sp. VG12]|uniref:type VI secretion system-associated protein TagF n=1 Tax=Labrenzia sp. VG12 TaxID=2021862 RepID=UPI000B8BD51C|nr:type VI secretion system-associated protein TagF [Labrenzia sp. VG12]ASP32610.1 type VI secretion-associated protein [Labrenzia sp. VG12]